MKHLLLFTSILFILASCKKEKLPQGQGNQVKVFEPIAQIQNIAGGITNLGQQYNTAYGCYLDALRGQVWNSTEAKNRPNSIDVAFIAYRGTGAYYFFAPNFARTNPTADIAWSGSASTDNPVKSWASVNETEVAATTLTPADFNNIQNNGQLNNAISSVKDWGGFWQSNSRLDNKVLALRVNLDNRKLVALVFVQEHIGTDGANGYLKIRIKVTGVDNNNDDLPDPDYYRTR